MATTVSGTGNPSSTGTLTAPGIGSGLDIKGLVSQLMAVEQKPLSLLATQEAKYQAKLSSLGSIKGSLSTLQSAAQSLATTSELKNRVLPSDAAVLSASAESSAIPGKHTIAVSKLAQSQKLMAEGQSSTTAAIGSGTETTLTFSFGTIASALGPETSGPNAGKYSDATFTPDPGGSSTVTVTIDSSNNTLAGIRDAINAADAGVTASIVNDGGASPYRLVLSSDNTGLASSMKIAVSGDSSVDALLGYDPAPTAGPAYATQHLAQTQAAQNAALTVDGLSITSATNTVVDAIQGVTLNLAKETTSGSPISVTIQRDNSTLSSALSALVKAYNDSNSVIAGATAKSAVLQGDSGVIGVQYQIRSIMSGAQQTSGTYTVLSQLGVSFQKDGTLALDTAKLNTALSSNSTAVMALTLATGNAIDAAVTSLLGTSGPIASKTESITGSIAAIGTRRSQIQLHLEAVQKRYQAQFTALDTLISNMNQTSTYLTQQLANLSNLNSSKG